MRRETDGDWLSWICIKLEETGLYFSWRPATAMIFSGAGVRQW